MKTVKLLFLVIWMVSFGFAQQPAGQVQKTIVHAAHLLDVKTGKTLDDVNVIIEGEKIAAITQGTPPAGSKVINLAGATLLPGLIDAHTHLTFDPNFGYQELGISIPKEALIGAKNARITLQAGFTTVRNVGARGYT
ncbi:MAG: amidohydrolase family protein, partial [Candidatus Angelobacter sp.]